MQVTRVRRVTGDGMQFGIAGADWEMNWQEDFEGRADINPLKPSGHYMYRQFNIQQFYVLLTQCVCVFLCGSQNKQPLFPYTALTDWFL